VDTPISYAFKYYACPDEPWHFCFTGHRDKLLIKTPHNTFVIEKVFDSKDSGGRYVVTQKADEK
jgi:hypothetical protein